MINDKIGYSNRGKYEWRNIYWPKIPCGFMVVATNTDETNYVKLGTVLADRMKWYDKVHITLITDPKSSLDVTSRPEMPFNSVYRIDPTIDVIPDVQAYYLSPYQHTIKIEADMISTGYVNYWFDILTKQPNDVVISTTIRDHTGKISDCRYYRNIIDANGLPDTYNGLTYFRKSHFAEDFFELVNMIYYNWADFRDALRMPYDTEFALDEAYAIASAIMGEENTTLPTFTDFSFVHCKRGILPTKTDVWYNEMTVEMNKYQMKIDTHPQLYPVHYHNKEAVEMLIDRIRFYHYVP